MQPDHPRTLRIEALRPFVPAKDFERCKQFYADLGFRVEPLGEGLAEMHFGPHSFLLQDYYVPEWAGNFVMRALVESLDDWWAHISSLDLAARYGLEAPRAPKLESWGLVSPTCSIRRACSGTLRSGLFNDSGRERSSASRVREAVTPLQEFHPCQKTSRSQICSSTR